MKPESKAVKAEQRPSIRKAVRFQKFKKDDKFVNAVTEFENSKTTINFKIDIVKSYRQISKNEKVLYLPFLP